LRFASVFTLQVWVVGCGRGDLGVWLICRVSWTRVVQTGPRMRSSEPEDVADMFYGSRRHTQKEREKRYFLACPLFHLLSAAFYLFFIIIIILVFYCVNAAAISPSLLSESSRMEEPNFHNGPLGQRFHRWPRISIKANYVLFVPVRATRTRVLSENVRVLSDGFYIFLYDHRGRSHKNTAQKVWI